MTGGARSNALSAGNGFRGLHVLSLPPPDPVAALRLLPWSPPAWSRSCGSCCCRTPSVSAGYGQGRPGRASGRLREKPYSDPQTIRQATEQLQTVLRDPAALPALCDLLASAADPQVRLLPLPAERPIARHWSRPQLAPCGPFSTFLPKPSRACFLVPDPPVRGSADPQKTEHPLATADS